MCWKILDRRWEWVERQVELRGNKMIRWSSDQQWIRRGQERQLGEKSLRSPGSTPPARWGQWLGRFGMLEGGNVFIDMGVGRVKGWG